METTSRGHKIALAALALWLVVRMLVLVPVFRHPGRVQLIDTNTYLELATSLVERGTYEGYSRDNIDLVRTPGYPAFAAAALALGGGNLAVLALAQVLLTIGTCAAVYAIGRRALNPTAGLAAAWLYALSPTSLFYALTALTETLFAFTLSFAVLLLIRYHQEGGRRWAAASGLLLGLSTLVRPIGVFLIPLAFIFAYLSQTWQSRRQRLFGALFVLGAGYLVLVPWQLRNLVVNDTFSLTPVGEATVRNWMVAPGLAEAKGVSREQAVAEIAAAEDRDAYMLEVIRTYPGPMLRAQLTGLFRTLVGFEYSTWMNLLDVEHRPGRDFVNAALARNLPKATREGRELLQQGLWLPFALPTWALGHTLALFALCAISLLYLALDERCRWCYALLALVAAYLLISPLAAGQARFRVPADPLLAVLAGLGLVGGATLLGRWWQTRRQEPEISRRLTDIIE
jgi:hypothetical protein